MTAAAGLVVAGLLALPSSAAPAPAPRATYIVKLTSAAAVPPVADVVSRLGGVVGHRYRHVFNGFAVTLPVTALPRLQAFPGVASVSANVRVHADQTETNLPAWGIDRIDQRALPLNDSFTTRYTGKGVTVYVIDSGINFNHQEYKGRVVHGVDVIDGGRADDCDGHGSHVAGTIGGTRTGVAKDVKLVAVRVLDCDGNGDSDGVISALDWVINNHRGGPAVLNMSLDGVGNSATDDAVNAAVADGITAAVAAGNDAGGLLGDLLGNSNACNHSPAGARSALTVAATDRKDQRADYSNFGSCVDLFAPGNGIVSAWKGASNQYAIASGTSMASPHVAGAAALILQRYPNASPAEINQRLLDQTTRDVVSDARNGTPNRLLFVS